MATIEQALAIAVQHHQAGRLAEAGDIYRRVLDVDPENFNALHLLGLVRRQTAGLPEAIALIRQALKVNAAFPEAHNNLANALNAAGRTEEATASYRRTIALNPGFPLAYYNLGSLLCTHGGPGLAGEAIASLSRAVALQPGAAEAHHDLGVALRQAERLDAAIASYRQAIALKPETAASHMSLGNALTELGDREQALAAFQRGVALAPAGLEIHYNLGNALHARGDLEGALAAFQIAAALGMAAACARIGAVLIQMGRPAEAEAELRRSLTLRGADVVAAIEMLTRIFVEDGRLDEARGFFDALARTPLADGFLATGECLTALATLDLHQGRPRAAAATLARVAGDNSRFFTVKSIAAFRSTLEDLGQSFERPLNHDPGRPRITSSTLATHGRFAHNVLEYVLVRLYAEKYGYVLETPDWVGGYFFDLDDPAPSGPLSPLYFPRRIVNDLVTGRGGRPPVADCDILSPLFLFEHKEDYRERVQSWLKPRPVWRPFLDPAMQRLREAGSTVVAVHIRRGDFVQFKYPITETAWYLDWLRALWPTLERPVLYVASDDRTIYDDFAEFSPLTRTDVVADWPGLEYLQDFHVLMHADVVGISAASGYSLLAARLNTTARLFAEPDVEARRIRPFSPWTA